MPGFLSKKNNAKKLFLQKQLASFQNGQQQTNNFQAPSVTSKGSAALMYTDDYGIPYTGYGNATGQQ